MLSLIVFLPLFSSLCSGFWGFKLGIKGVALITCGSLLLSGVLSFWGFYTVGLSLLPAYIVLSKWIVLEGFYTHWGLAVDSMSLLMFILVTLVSSLVYIYTLVYMLEDPHLIRFSCYITLFTFFMLILVSSDNFIQLFFGWEGVGLASYLLINFWYTRIQANKAAIQALIVNKVGDIAVLLGISVGFYTYYTVDFSLMFALTPHLLDRTLCIGNIMFSSLTILTFFLFIGAIGKSAQLGLHTWLPSAMEGPTPVSALIHAATMVTAGVFLIIRCSPIFEYVDTVLLWITFIGALTAFFSATVGMLQNDIKRIIAYSTCSQLGYMIFACGLSAYSVSFFHLVNHGFFKALLFLSAGSVIHGFSDEQDLRRMGGLGKLFPLTYCMFIIGSLSLMGFPFLSGFFSKDVILEMAFARYSISGIFAYWFGTLSAFFTAFYSFRLIYLAFLSANNSPRALVQKAHESSGLISGVLCMLGVGSLLSGFLLKDIFIGMGSLFLGNSIWVLSSHFSLFEAEFLPFSVKIIPLLFSISGACLALLLNHLYDGFLVFLKRAPIVSYFYIFFNQKWCIDMTYTRYIVLPMFHISYLVPFRVLDKGFIELIGPLGVMKSFTYISKRLSLFQTGLIYHYTFIVVLGILGYTHLVLFFEIIESYVRLDIVMYYIFITVGATLL